MSYTSDTFDASNYYYIDHTNGRNYYYQEKIIPKSTIPSRILPLIKEYIHIRSSIELKKILKTLENDFKTNTEFLQIIIEELKLCKWKYSRPKQESYEDGKTKSSDFCVVSLPASNTKQYYCHGLKIEKETIPLIFINEIKEGIPIRDRSDIIINIQNIKKNLKDVVKSIDKVNIEISIAIERESKKETKKENNKRSYNDSNNIFEHFFNFNKEGNTRFSFNGSNQSFNFNKEGNTGFSFNPNKRVKTSWNEWKNVFDEFQQKYHKTKSETKPNEKEKAILFLNGLNINDKLSYKKWLLRNHPDKNQSNVNNTQTNLVAEVNASIKIAEFK